MFFVIYAYKTKLGLVRNVLNCKMKLREFDKPFKTVLFLDGIARGQDNHPKQQ